MKSTTVTVVTQVKLNIYNAPNSQNDQLPQPIPHRLVMEYYPNSASIIK